MNSAPASSAVCDKDLTLLCKGRRIIKELSSCLARSGSQPTAGEQPLQGSSLCRRAAAATCLLCLQLLAWPLWMLVSLQAGQQAWDRPKDKPVTNRFCHHRLLHHLLERATKAERTPPRLFSKERSLTQTPTQGQCTRGSTLPRQHPSPQAPTAVREVMAGHTNLSLSQKSLFPPTRLLFLTKKCHIWGEKNVKTRGNNSVLFLDEMTEIVEHIKVTLSLSFLTLRQHLNRANEPNLTHK